MAKAKCAKMGCYSDSTSATCAKCKKVIGKDAPRHSFLSFGGSLAMVNYCCKCVPGRR